jgi:hypothetical protein
MLYQIWKFTFNTDIVAYQDIIKGDTAGAGTELKELNANFLNDSSLIYQK